MKYSNLIEPYLYGHLSPEEEVVFERQLTLDPELAEETARRFHRERPQEPSSGYEPSPEAEADETPASTPSNKLLSTGLVLLLLCLLWWAMRPSKSETKEAGTPTEQTHPVQSEVPSR